jgi:hypothetical protein
LKCEGKREQICVILIDNCLPDVNLINKEGTMLSNFLFNARHYDIITITTVQYPLGIPPDLRLNFYYIHLFADDNYANQKRLFEHYCGMFPSFESFRQTFNQLTMNNACMTICNRITEDLLKGVVNPLAIDNPEKTDVNELLREENQIEEKLENRQLLQQIYKINGMISKL